METQGTSTPLKVARYPTEGRGRDAHGPPITKKRCTIERWTAPFERENRKRKSARDTEKGGGFSQREPSGEGEDGTSKSALLT